MDNTKNEDYLFRISCEISDLYTIWETFSSLNEHLLTEEYLKQLGGTRVILVYLRNSLLEAFYVRVRSMLSTGKDEISIPNLFKDTQRLTIEPEHTYNESLLIKCLPNHYATWVKLKKYIDKNIAHKDADAKKTALEGNKITPTHLKELIDDLESTYNTIADCIGEPQGSLNPSNSKCLADALFKRWKKA